MTVNENGKLLPLSSGKGHYSQAIASGLFEAIEHYYYLNGRDTHIKMLSVSDIIKQKKSLLGIVPLNLLMDADVDIPCLKLKNLVLDDTIWYPKCFIMDSKDKNDISNFVLKYVSNNGIAVGLSEKEALIHALNEIMERETLS